MTFAPYIFFQGNCAEAMTFYADVFGATDLQMMRYSEAPEGTGMPPSDRVMHASLTAGGRPLMASDFPEGVAGEPQAGVSVSFELPDREAGEATFQRLAEGGTVIMPFGPTFWSTGFGMVKDRFGTNWMISGPESQG